MADNSSSDYRALFLQAEEGRRLAEEGRRLAEEGRKRAEEGHKLAEEGRKRAEEGRRLAEQRNLPTTFPEFIRACHTLLSIPLRVAASSRSTKGTIPQPKGKYCPTNLLQWADLPAKQQDIFTSVCNYLEPVRGAAPRHFPPHIALEELSRRISHRPLSSEQDLETYERLAVEDHIVDIIDELCKIPEAQKEFGLGDGVRFENHANSLDDAYTNQSDSQRARPDQFCIHRLDNNMSTLLTTVEYKPPHKLSVENLRTGLRPMNFWETVVKPRTIPIKEKEKLKYNAQHISGSAVTQHYHTMIEDGIPYAYLTNGLALVLLHIPYEDPSTLYYYLCEPNLDLKAEDSRAFDQPKTALARALCLCLMSFRSAPRDQNWRNAARAQLHIWKTSFDYTLSEIPEEELRQVPPDSEYTSSEYTGSEYLPSSPTSPPESRRMPTRSQPGCSPSDLGRHMESTDSSDSDSNQMAPGRKRGFSQITSSPPTQRAGRSDSHNAQGGRFQQNTAKFCTQRCLLGLCSSDLLDYNCPNVTRHQHGEKVERHHINGSTLLRLLNQQLDHNLDHNCWPLGNRGAYGSLFKLTCAEYGYTVAAKGTTSTLWTEVSGEAEIYRILQRVQGAATTVFVGSINLAKTYFLHGFGQVRHMLLMAWGGDSIAKLEQWPTLRQEILKSKKEFRALGVIHGDLRPENMLWNDELKRVLLIDLHKCPCVAWGKENLIGSGDFSQNRRDIQQKVKQWNPYIRSTRANIKAMSLGFHPAICNKARSSLKVKARDTTPVSAIIMDENKKKKLLGGIDKFLDERTRVWYARRGIEAKPLSQSICPSSSNVRCEGKSFGDPD
ncbi:hypothetical protein BDBG_05866 [Blastomyces gilchristii SLH14081]|uniref:Protein kinase domain-containing protein n=1 Tax=Blastomyces gilchristii (strain SLH14081) TaxID=559298 RepID=A0A179UQ22_BLAGS|nr:uncharacterized protein BDBG_05866 [Blastomyces gilchristii SLH14081]OAT10196.1 hypothetical protein BDBG_05866 [Blastomyces gilchristii SLH14081]